MRKAEGNPDSNQLGPRITEEALQAAITRSGYPLQGVVVPAILKSIRDRLGDAVRISSQDEWVYVDSGSGRSRAVDALLEVD